MRREEIRFCVLRAPGTNCDAETKYSLEYFGAAVEVVHINKFVRGEKSLEDFHGLVIPGGFSYGDHIRSGAIMGKILGEKFGREVQAFASEGKPVLGICNGFQVLVESGILPGFERISPQPQAALAKNASSHFEDRWIYLKNANRGRCFFSKGIKIIHIPVTHGEGRFLLPKEKEKQLLKQLEKNDQIVFRYVTKEGKPARGKYPFNPNGALADIAGICSPEGNVLGMMPHPEKAFHGITHPDWTRCGLRSKGDGFAIFKNMVDYVKKRK